MSTQVDWQIGANDNDDDHDDQDGYYAHYFIMMIVMMIMMMIMIMIIRVALVERDISFTPDMSVRQTLLFHRYHDHCAVDDDDDTVDNYDENYYGNVDFSLMREPGTLTRGRDTKGRINALIEDLGLSQVSTMVI